MNPPHELIGFALVKAMFQVFPFSIKRSSGPVTGWQRLSGPKGRPDSPKDLNQPGIARKSVRCGSLLAIGQKSLIKTNMKKIAKSDYDEGGLDFFDDRIVISVR